MRERELLLNREPAPCCASVEFGTVGRVEPGIGISPSATLRAHSQSRSVPSLHETLLPALYINVWGPSVSPDVGTEGQALDNRTERPRFRLEPEERQARITAKSLRWSVGLRSSRLPVIRPLASFRHRLAELVARVRGIVVAHERQALALPRVAVPAIQRLRVRHRVQRGEGELFPVR